MYTDNWLKKDYTLRVPGPTTPSTEEFQLDLYAYLEYISPMTHFYTEHLHFLRKKELSQLLVSKIWDYMPLCNE